GIRPGGNGVGSPRLRPPDQLLGFAALAAPPLALLLGAAQKVAGIEGGGGVFPAREEEAGHPEPGRRPVRPADERALIEPVGAVAVTLVPENILPASQSV